MTGSDDVLDALRRARPDDLAEREASPDSPAAQALLEDIVSRPRSSVGTARGGVVGAGRRPVLAVAAALAVAAGVSGVAAARTSGGADVVADGAALPGDGDGLTCGDEMPAEVTVPPGFEGPFPGPSDNMPNGFAPDGTLVLHWRSADQTVDFRWPTPPGGDDDRMPPYPFHPWTDLPGVVERSHGAWDAYLDTRCMTYDLVVVAPDEAAADATTDAITQPLSFDSIVLGPPDLDASG